MRGNITADFTIIKRIIKKYFEQLYGNKFNNLYEMNKFFERQKHSKMLLLIEISVLMLECGVFGEEIFLAAWLVGS